MQIILTGYSGFLGKTIESICENRGYTIYRLGRNNHADLIWDFLSEAPPLTQSELVIHCAGLAHKKSNSKNKNKFFEINYLATRNFCEALELQNKIPKKFIFISSVSVYGVDKGCGISEFHNLSSSIPYGESKILAEKYLQNWAIKNEVNLLILRLPLVAGSNPPGNLGKMIKGIKRGTYFSIGGGRARKSMVLAEDVANFISECPDVIGTYNLTDGYHPSFAELETIICEQLKRPKPLNIPLGLAKILGKIGDLTPMFPFNSEIINKISQDLTFSDLKARQELGWNPSRVIDKWRVH